MNKDIQNIGNGLDYAKNAVRIHRASSGINFSKVLERKTEGLKFSSHAKSRLKSRNIEMSPEKMKTLEEAVSKAEGKGAKDSLVLLSDLAFIVNIPNKTVVTTMDGANVRDNIFTNIDSAVVAG